MLNLGRGDRDDIDIAAGEFFFGLGAAHAQRAAYRRCGAVMQHGMAKFFHVPHVASLNNVQLMSLIGLAGVLEVGGGLLLLIGLFTRPVAFVLSGEMAFAYFMAHAPKDLWLLLNGDELAVVYCFVFLYFSVTGGGAWSVDAKIRTQV